ncbi:MAG: CBS domain-containing protein [Candidatus Aenigmatarchaeota archaeon]
MIFIIVADIMNKRPKFVTPNTTVQEAAKIMSEFRIGSVIVIDNGKVVGILTERDILTKLVSKGERPETTLVKDIMTKKVHFINQKASLEDAANMMVKYEIKKLPVIDDNENLVGIITASDIIAFEKKLIERISFLMVSRKETYVGG